MNFIERAGEGYHHAACTRGVGCESDLYGLAGFVDLEEISVEARKGRS